MYNYAYKSYMNIYICTSISIHIYIDIYTYIYIQDTNDIS